MTPAEYLQLRMDLERVLASLPAETLVDMARLVVEALSPRDDLDAPEYTALARLTNHVSMLDGQLGMFGGERL